MWRRCWPRRSRRRGDTPGSRCRPRRPAGGICAFSSASPWKVKASSAPWACAGGGDTPAQRAVIRHAHDQAALAAHQGAVGWDNVVEHIGPRLRSGRDAGFKLVAQPRAAGQGGGDLRVTRLPWAWRALGLGAPWLRLQCAPVYREPPMADPRPEDTDPGFARYSTPGWWRRSRTNRIEPWNAMDGKVHGDADWPALGADRPVEGR